MVTKLNEYNNNTQIMPTVHFRDGLIAEVTSHCVLCHNGKKLTFNKKGNKGTYRTE